MPQECHRQTLRVTSVRKESPGETPFHAGLSRETPGETLADAGGGRVYRCAM